MRSCTDYLTTRQQFIVHQTICKVLRAFLWQIKIDVHNSCSPPYHWSLGLFHVHHETHNLPAASCHKCAPVHWLPLVLTHYLQDMLTVAVPSERQLWKGRERPQHQSTNMQAKDTLQRKLWVWLTQTVTIQAIVYSDKINQQRTTTPAQLEIKLIR